MPQKLSDLRQDMAKARLWGRLDVLVGQKGGNSGSEAFWLLGHDDAQQELEQVAEILANLDHKLTK